MNLFETDNVDLLGISHYISKSNSCVHSSISTPHYYNILFPKENPLQNYLKTKQNKQKKKTPLLYYSCLKCLHSLGVVVCRIAPFCLITSPPNVHCNEASECSKASATTVDQL